MSTLQGESPPKGRPAKDPYEEYLRHERRRHRMEITIVVATLLTMLAILSAAVFWHLEGAPATRDALQEHSSS
jgi:hypothetical protein